MTIKAIPISLGSEEISPSNKYPIPNPKILVIAVVRNQITVKFGALA